MITGGYSSGSGLDQVSLFNWMTREQCALPALPYKVSGNTLIDLWIDIYIFGPEV